MDSIPKQINQFYLPEWLTVELIASNFITFTPLFSYGTTIISIYRKQTSLGFSIDICATMLIASILRICYYFIIPYETALLRQSIVMVFIQSILLKVSLSYRPRNYDVDQLELDSTLWEDCKCVYDGFVAKRNEDGFNLLIVLFMVKEVVMLMFIHFVRFYDPNFKRVGEFWQWNSERNYWKFIIRFALVISILTYIFRNYTNFGESMGTIGLFVESLLPLPQILLLNKLKSIEGFKLLLLLSWLCGDCTKISYLIFGAKNISGIFLFFATFQMGLDIYIAFQYIYFKYYYDSQPEIIEMTYMHDV